MEHVALDVQEALQCTDSKENNAQISVTDQWWHALVILVAQKLERSLKVNVF